MGTNMIDNYRVNRWMASGLLCLSLVLTANTAVADSLPMSITGKAQAVFDVNGKPKGLFGSFFNRGLSSEDRRQHIQAIMVALEKSQNGELVEWWGRESGDRGIVRVVYTYGVGTGYCRVFQTYLVIDGDVSQYQETACLELNQKGWEFYNK
jgi:surface antigen